MSTINLIGERFGRLFVGGRGPNTPAGKARWLCLCDCGKEKAVTGAHLRNGITTSCGCRMVEVTVARSTKHGQAKRSGFSGTYSSWADMVKRCTNPNNWAWKYYGGRGVTVCPEWVADFQAFYDYMGDRPPKLTLDRINNDGNYEPGNCRWADRKTQANNRRGVRVATSPGSGREVSDGAPTSIAC